MAGGPPGGDPNTDASTPVDFELTKYNLDRGHELELNKFTHTLELEQLKLLILLNGGAATALLTFTEESTAQANGLWFPLAIGCWLVGLLVGAGATMAMRLGQSEFANAYRHRRRATEWRQLGVDKEVTGEDLVRLLGLPERKRLGLPETRLLDLRDNQIRDMPENQLRDLPDQELLKGELLRALQRQGCLRPVDPIVKGAGAILYDKAAGGIVGRAGRINGMIVPLSVASLVLFIAGAVAAAVMLHFAPAVSPVPLQPIVISIAPR